MKGRVVTAMKASEKALENYSCIVTEHDEELNSGGAVKKHDSKEEEQFYVNGIEIDHTLKKNGTPLAEAEARKEQQRVDKEVKKYSNAKEADKALDHDEKEVDMFLRAVRFANGRRTDRDGRSLLVYDLSGDPAFHPKKLEERFAEALNGQIWIDEQSGMVAEVRFETTKDVKVGGGLLANLHKGFWLHIVQQREPDGVWITQSVDGRGDARAALFVHARFQFKEQLDGCHLFSVTTQQKIQDRSRSVPNSSNP
jgi:hypothetical protein